MASTIHAPPYPQVPPPFAEHGHSGSMNGSFPQPQLTSFDGSQSVASTPAPTPPPARPGSQQQMSYMNGGSFSNGMVSRPSFNGYPDPALYPPLPYYPKGVKVQIYTAVYSNVSVYEMEVNGVAVMRRRADSWLNATQILKVAGVDKGKRTKVLEKEVQTGDHEKVQGGYGKYQGTWINYSRGVKFCRQYGVEQLLRPLLEYDLSQDGAGREPQTLDTPTKEQAMAAQRKRMYSGPDGGPINPSAGGTFFNRMSSTAANAVSALNKTRMDSPSRGMDSRRSIGPRRPSQQHYGHDSFQGSQQSMHSMNSQDSFSAQLPNGVGLSQGASFADFPNTDSQEPPRKRIRPSPGDSFINAFDGALELSMQGGSPTEANQSFFSQHSQSYMALNEDLYGLEPLAPPTGPLDEQKKDLLLDLFIDPSRTDFNDHPAFLRMSGEEFEMPIDGSCNTALHWAATLARIPLVRKLLERGFNMRRTNSGGETALIAACQARNNMDHGAFPALLQMLGPSIEIRDGRGRTVLHHIAVSAAMKQRAAVGKYYLEMLLQHIIQSNGAADPRYTSFTGMTSPNPLTFARFMNEVVNAQDKVGDTALNVAARTSTSSIVDQLIEIGADPHIANRGGLAPVDFGVTSNENGIIHDHNVIMRDAPAATTSSSQQSFAEAQSGMLTSIREILSASEADFAAELKEKQEDLDKTNAALKESGSALAEEKKRLEMLQAKAREKTELEQKIRNLQRTAEEIRGDLARSSGPGPSISDDQVTVGDADKGLDFGGHLAAVEHLFPNGIPDPALPLTPEQLNFLSSLERAEVLSGRVRAYQQHNQGLETQANTLKSRSTELEERYRRMVSLCTATEVSKVDGILDNLLQAVMSEQKESVDPGRVRDFLRIIEGNES